MALPTVVVRDDGHKDRVIILLSGYDAKPARVKGAGVPAPFAVIAEDELLASACRDRDAVAFGYVGGRWVAAA